MGGGREAFCTRMFRCWSFSKCVPLDCELHEYSFIFPFPATPLLGEQDGHSGHKLGISLFPGQLNSDTIPAVRLWLNSFPQGRSCWEEQNALADFKIFFLLSLPKTQWHSLWEPGRAPGAKTHKSMGPLPCSPPPRVLSPKFVYTSF